MRKAVSGGGVEKIRKKWWEKTFQEVKGQSSKNPKKKMRKDVLGDGEVKFQKIRKHYEKRRFKRWRRPNSENPKKWWEKTFQEVDFKNSEQMMRKDVSRGGEVKI